MTSYEKYPREGVLYRKGSFDCCHSCALMVDSSLDIGSNWRKTSGKRAMLICCTGTFAAAQNPMEVDFWKCDVVVFTAAHFFWILWCATIPLYQMEIKLLACVALKKLRGKSSKDCYCWHDWCEVSGFCTVEQTEIFGGLCPSRPTTYSHWQVGSLWVKSRDF